MPQLRGESHGIGSISSHDECAFRIHRGLSVAGKPFYDNATSAFVVAAKDSPLNEALRLPILSYLKYQLPLLD